MYSFSHKYSKLGPRASNVFIRYLKVSKGYVMYGGYANRRMTKIESRDVEFFEDEFSRVGEVDKDF